MVSTRWRRRVTRIVLIVGAILIVGAVAAFLSDQLGPIDPADPGWKARVTNDTGQFIHVRSPRADIRIAPGSQETVISPGPGQLHAVYRISDDKGTLLGCLTVDLDKHRTLDINASSMNVCTE
jgi:hypothetical protein